MKVLLKSSQTMIYKIWTIFVPELLPIFKILLGLSCLNLSGKNEQAQILSLSYLFVEFIFSVCSVIPDFMRQMFYFSPVDLRTNKRIFSITFLIIFLSCYCTFAILTGIAIYTALRHLDPSNQILSDSHNLLIYFSIAKIIQILKDLMFKFLTIEPLKLVYETVLFHTLEFILVIFLVLVDGGGITGYLYAIFTTLILWLFIRFLAVWCYFRDDFIFVYKVRNLLSLFLNQSINLLEFYLDKSVTFLNIKYTVIFLIYYERTDQVISLAIVVLFLDLLAKLGYSISKFNKLKFQNLIGIGRFEGVYERANKLLKIVLFFCGLLALICLLFSPIFAYLFEIDQTRKSTLSLVFKILGFSGYSFICNPILFMLLRINGKDSLGYSVMWFLENKFRLGLTIGCFFIFSRWGIFGLLLTHVSIDIFMALLLFRTYRLYYILKDITNKSQNVELERQFID